MNTEIGAEGNSRLARSRLEMRLGAFHQLVALSCILLASCASNIASPTAGRVAAGSYTVDTTDAQWVDIKYRRDPVNVGAHRFEALDPLSSSFIDNAWYSREDQYLVVVLNGVGYQHCSIDSATWDQFASAESKGSFYSRNIRGQFGC